MKISINLIKSGKIIISGNFVLALAEKTTEILQLTAAFLITTILVFK